jgi:hypothetical protein
VRLRYRVPLLVLAAAAAAAGAWLVRAPMRITLVNATLRIDDPWTRAGGLALAAASAALLAASLSSRRPHRVLLSGCAAVLAVLAAGAATQWLEARPDALAAGRYFTRTTVPWGEIARVEARQDGVTVWAASGGAIDFDARRLTGEQRAVLDRTLARRVGKPISAR